MSESSQHLGKKGEKLALQYIRNIGYSVVVKNYRQKFGEIDIIAMDRDVLVFIEVKTRSNTQHGSPFAAITTKKQRQISKVALAYLSRNKLFDKDARFDVISVLIDQKKTPVIELLKNAFDLSYGV